MNPKTSTVLFCVVDPNGVLVHTTISTSVDGAVEEWMNIEGTMNDFTNMFRAIRKEARKCFKSWEQFEAEGYAVIKVSIIPEYANKTQHSS